MQKKKRLPNWRKNVAYAGFSTMNHFSHVRNFRHDVREEIFSHMQKNKQQTTDESVALFTREHLPLPNWSGCPHLDLSSWRSRGAPAPAFARFAWHVQLVRRSLYREFDWVPPLKWCREYWWCVLVVGKRLIDRSDRVHVTIFRIIAVSYIQQIVSYIQ